MQGATFHHSCTSPSKDKAAPPTKCSPCFQTLLVSSVSLQGFALAHALFLPGQSQSQYLRPTSSSRINNGRIGNPRHFAEMLGVGGKSHPLLIYTIDQSSSLYNWDCRDNDSQCCRLCGQQARVAVQKKRGMGLYRS